MKTIRFSFLFLLLALFCGLNFPVFAAEIEDTEKQIEELTRKMDVLQGQLKGATVEQRRTIDNEKRALFKQRNSAEKLLVQLKNKAKKDAHWGKVNADKAAKETAKAQEKAAEDAAKNVEYTFTGNREELIRQRDEMIQQVIKSRGGNDKNHKYKLEAINKKINSMNEEVTSLEDKYQGDDKEELRKLILEEWKKKYPQDVVLRVAFHMAQFKRDVEAKLNETSIYKVDHSVLAVSVAVKKDDSLAIIYPAYVNRDNLSKSQNIGVDTKGNAYVQKEILLSNLK